MSRKGVQSQFSYYIMMMLSCASIFSGSYLFLNLGVGGFDELLSMMLLTSHDTSILITAVVFSFTFLISRLSEAIGTNILDIGGALMTGIGVGFPALFMILNMTWPLASFRNSLVSGALIGSFLAFAIQYLQNHKYSFNIKGLSNIIGVGNTVFKYYGIVLLLVSASFDFRYGFAGLLGAIVATYCDVNLTTGVIVAVAVACLF